MIRSEVINHIIKRIDAEQYLEIGVGRGKNFRRVQCKSKTSVDPGNGHGYGPVSNPTFKLTSDDFFKVNNTIFDVVFIDGLHKAEQIYLDIINSLNCLSENGAIVCHDMNPEREEVQAVPRISYRWLGDGWKALVKLRSESSDLQTHVVDVETGLGIIQKGFQEKLKVKDDLTIYLLLKPIT